LTSSGKGSLGDLFNSDVKPIVRSVNQDRPAHNRSEEDMPRLTGKVALITGTMTDPLLGIKHYALVIRGSGSTVIV
jgi:hypothetical protein